MNSMVRFISVSKTVTQLVTFKGSYGPAPMTLAKNIHSFYSWVQALLHDTYFLMPDNDLFDKF